MANTPDKSGSQTTKKECEKDLYTALVQLTIHGQENKLQTLNLYLVFNSIIILAWATLFSSDSLILTAKLASTFFCILGILLALVWMVLGWDYANASDLFSEFAERIESKFPECMRPLQCRAKQKEKKVPIGSRTLLILIPIFFLLMYIFLLVLVWARCN